MGGVPSTDRTNPLGEAPEVHFHSERHSQGLTFGEQFLSVTFPPNVSDKVAYLNRSLHKGCSTHALKMRLRLECGEDSEVVVGFSKESGDTATPHLATSDNYYLFNITRGCVSLEGKATQIPPLPTCGSGGEVEWELDMATDIIQYTVFNTGGSIPTPIPMKIDRGIPNEVWPLVGVLHSDHGKVELQVVQFSQPTECEEARFEEQSAFGGVQFKDGGKKVSRPNSTGNCFFVVNKRLDIGRYRWTIKVDCDVGASLCLGIVKFPFTISEDYSDHLKHIYRHKQFLCWRSYRGFLYANGNQLPKTLEPLGWLQNRSIKVEFLLDLQKGTLEISRDGLSLGIAFENIRGPVKPAVAFYAGYEKSVELVDFKTDQLPMSPSEPLLLVPGSAPPLLKSKVHFDSTSLHGDLRVSEDCFTVLRDKSHSGNAYCLLDMRCTSGVYRWSFILECDQGASTCIGITTEPVEVDSKTNIYTSRSMYLCRSFQGMLYNQGIELSKRLSEFWMEGTLVEVVLDLENCALQYIVNGEDQGVAFGNLHAPSYRPVVAFYASMEKKITLVHFEHQEPSPPQLHSLRVAEINNLESDDTPVKRTDKNEDGVFLAAVPDVTVEACMVCGARDSHVIALPCRHSVYCAAHTRTDGSQKCLVCDEIITGVWNVF